MFYKVITNIIIKNCFNVLGELVYVSDDRRSWERSDGHAYFILPEKRVHAAARNECSKALEGAYPAIFEDIEEWNDTKVCTT